VKKGGKRRREEKEGREGGKKAIQNKNGTKRYNHPIR
jgi:hypothetical protein